VENKRSLTSIKWTSSNAHVGPSNAHVGPGNLCRSCRPSKTRYCSARLPTPMPRERSCASCRRGYRPLRSRTDMQQLAGTRAPQVARTCRRCRRQAARPTGATGIETGSTAALQLPLGLAALLALPGRVGAYRAAALTAAWLAPQPRLLLLWGRGGGAPVAANASGEVAPTAGPGGPALRTDRARREWLEKELDLCNQSYEYRRVLEGELAQVGVQAGNHGPDTLMRPVELAGQQQVNFKNRVMRTRTAQRQPGTMVAEVMHCVGLMCPANPGTLFGDCFFFRTRHTLHVMCVGNRGLGGLCTCAPCLLARLGSRPVPIIRRERTSTVSCAM
jgi:hypothetical protein